MPKKKLRKAFVLREVEIDFSDVQKGDIYRLGKATPKDQVNEQQFAIAQTDAYSEFGTRNKDTIDGVDIAFVRCAHPKFSR